MSSDHDASQDASHDASQQEPELRQPDPSPDPSPDPTKDSAEPDEWAGDADRQSRRRFLRAAVIASVATAAAGGGVGIALATRPPEAPMKPVAFAAAIHSRP